MEVQYFKNYSSSLNRDMECKVYGHAGRPVLFIPCQNGRFYDFENFRMTDVWAPWIDAGKVMVFSIDTIDMETWSNTGSDPRYRIELHERWFKYITDEVIPFMRWMTNERNHWTGYPNVITFGCSLGAMHAANLFFRRPDLFDGVLALSGLYHAQYGFGNYMDDLVYANSPIDYLQNMPSDHPYINEYNQKRMVFCVGQGAWEDELLASTGRLAEILYDKGIHAWVDFWGKDCSHDWDWWYKQVPYFLPYILREQ